MSDLCLEKIRAKARKIRCLATDLDGVLTDGSVQFYHDGSMGKSFHIQDGQGIKLLLDNGIKVTVITGATNDFLAVRMQQLGIDHYYKGQVNKTQAFSDLLYHYDLRPEQVAYVGDDIPDLPLIQSAGLGIAVPNANDFIKPHADWVTNKPGGHGAIREVCDLLLKAQNLQTAMLKPFLAKAPHE